MHAHRDAPPDKTVTCNSTHTHTPNNPINKEIIEHLCKLNFAASVAPYMQFSDV